MFKFVTRKILQFSFSFQFKFIMEIRLTELRLESFLVHPMFYRAAYRRVK